MEKKKAILIAVIAGLFLVIVVAFPLILLSSKDKAPSSVATGIPQPSAALPQQPASIDINDLVNKNNVPPTTSSQSVIINNFDKKSDTSESSTIKNPDGTITINVLPAPVTVPQATPAQPAPQAEQSPPPQKPSAPAPKNPSVKPSDTAKPVTKPADTAKPVAKPADAPKPAAPKKQPSSTQAAEVDFWVQVGFFSTQAIADNAKAALANKGIIAIIQNASVNGKDGFRVRIGPYISNDEANYWLKLIRSMDGFSQSYTLQTKR
jgi:cell division protein FtsN